MSMTAEEAAAVAIALAALQDENEEGSTIKVDPYKMWREAARREVLMIDEPVQ